LPPSRWHGAYTGTAGMTRRAVARCRAGAIRGIRPLGAIMKDNRQLRAVTDINPDNWSEVSRLFFAAVSLGASARDVYLDEACHQDPPLRAAVESLLRSHDEAGSFGEELAFPLPESVKRLTPGSQLGPFRIESWLGAGGMGEVYRAHDTKLQRAVAIKVLPDSFANDPDRRSRFEEEARALAALNHPHIGAIYGLEETADVAALVLELVEGVTLAERLATGPMAHDEIVRIARQFAEGLEAAHDRGIVHRDLKPRNIQITPDGNVKILDFGLAKLEASQVHGASTGSAAGPRHATQVGVIVGTAGYMSPEQARGHPVDKRTDIWAFGCVLFTMCAGRPPFEVVSGSDTLSAVLERDPEWSLVPGSTPRYLVRLLRRCLTKDPKLRLRDIGEARIALELGEDADASHAPARQPRRLAASVAIASMLALAALLAVALYRPAPSAPIPPAMPVSFSVFPPAGGLFNFNPAQTFFALSPDGSRLAFLASTESVPLFVTGESRIWLREMAAVEARPLAGTDGARSAFWSPDSRSLAFFADGRLKRINLPDGPAVTISELPFGSTQGTWGADGVILVDHSQGTGIYAVPAAGGTTQEILTPNRTTGEVRVLWPWFLPDGRRFLFTALLDDGDGKLRVGTLDGSTRTVMSVSSNTQWIDPDIVVFAREGVLMGQRVDLEGPRPVGEPFSIAEQVEYFLTTSRATFAASPTGTVAYHPGGDLEQLVWVDRNGDETGTVSQPAAYNHQSARLSRDGRMLLTARRRPGLGTYDIWRLDLARQTEEQLTEGRGSELTPVWIDSERAILFAGDSPGSVPHLFRKDLATGTEEQILPSGSQQLVMDVLPGGRAVAYAERQTGGGFRAFQLPLTPGARPDLLLPPQFSSFGMRVSPDGRAIAFIAGRSGRRDLYVAQSPVTSEPVLAAAGVWNAPRWSPDGRELYYVGDDRTMMIIPIRSAPALDVGIPRNLFALKQPASLLEVSRDGRFLLLVPKVRAAEQPIIVGTAAISSAQR
jgi:Tol biopolymer transport system component